MLTILSSSSSCVWYMCKNMCHNTHVQSQGKNWSWNSPSDFIWIPGVPEEKPEKHQVPKILGEIFKKKMGFLGMSPFVPCIIDKMTLKPRSILGERREHADFAVPAVFCPVLMYTGPWWVRMSPCTIPHLETYWTSTHILIQN